MATRSTKKNTDTLQNDLFAEAASHTDPPTRVQEEIPGAIVIEPLGKGVRVTGRDTHGNVLWGFVASRTMLEQPHGAIAIYGKLRDLLNDRLATLCLPQDRPDDIVAAAEAEVESLERLVSSLRKKITVAKGKKATNGQIEQARDIYRAAHDLFLWMTQETSIEKPSEDQAEEVTADADAAL